MNIIVAYATPDKQVEIPVSVNIGCNVALAIKNSGILKEFPDIPFPDIQVGIYSRKVSLDASLHEGDRIEIYRPLTMDPKQARLLRARRAKANSD